MSGNDFFEFGIGNGKWQGLFQTFGNGNEKFNSQHLGLGIGMKNSHPKFWD